ncbi:MAG: L-fucose isomerase, partial [Clostridiales Family XIII bacterium]|nr:L-fucose isomerase [Clostridiales Family XIII bacterium]
MKIGIRPVIDGREGSQNVRASLEGQTMGMARAAKELIEGHVRTRDGFAAECVIADTTISGVAEAAACQEKFDRAGVCGTLTVTPCWCYGSETMDMDKTTPKAVWGFNGTERPGAVYLAAVLAAHTQKGIPVFSIYGREVQDATDTAIPEDVREKILRWARGVVAIGEMKGKSYLSVGNVAMGIAGSIVNPELFEKYFGMRCEYKDMTEMIRRIEQGVYDREAYDKARAWVNRHCVERADVYNGAAGKTRAEHDGIWDCCVKMALIMRDMMEGNPKLGEMGFHEESNGNNAIAAGFQGQRQWTDF